jgi:hypothetical protein
MALMVRATNVIQWQRTVRADDVSRMERETLPWFGLDVERSSMKKEWLVIGHQHGPVNFI